MPLPAHKKVFRAGGEFILVKCLDHRTECLDDPIPCREPTYNFGRIVNMGAAVSDVLPYDLRWIEEGDIVHYHDFTPTNAFTINGSVHYVVHARAIVGALENPDE